MQERAKASIRAILSMVGTIIGAGIFGIPPMMAKTGVLVGSILFLGIALFVVATHLLYVEIIVHDKQRRRLPGYLGKIVGPWGKWLGVFAYSCQLMGAGFAYVLLGGEFLATIATHLGISSNLWLWQLVFWIGSVITVTVGITFVTKVESILTWILIALILLMVIFSIPHIEIGRFFSSHWSEALAPLGVFLFALSGTAVIPEVHEMTQRNTKQTRRNVAVGTMVAALLTWGFGVAMYGAIGSQDVTPGSLAVLFPVGLWWLLPALGFLAVSTSYITGAFDLQATYRIDFSMSRIWAWLLTLGTPLLLLWISTRDFLATIGTVGALFTATTNILIVIAAFSLLNRQKQLSHVWWRILTPMVIMLLFTGVIVQRLVILFE